MNNSRHYSLVHIMRLYLLLPTLSLVCTIMVMLLMPVHIFIPEGMKKIYSCDFPSILSYMIVSLFTTTFWIGISFLAYKHNAHLRGISMTSAGIYFLASIIFLCILFLDDSLTSKMIGCMIYLCLQIAESIAIYGAICGMMCIVINSWSDVPELMNDDLVLYV